MRNSIELSIESRIVKVRCEDCVFGEKGYEVRTMVRLDGNRVDGERVGDSYLCHLAPPQMHPKTGGFLLPELHPGEYQACGFGKARGGE